MQRTKRVALILGFVLGLIGLFLYIAAVLPEPPKEPTIKIEPVPENLPRGTVGLQVGQIYKYELVSYELEPSLLKRAIKVSFWPIYKITGAPVHGRVTAEEEIIYKVADVVYFNQEPYFLIEGFQKSRLLSASPEEFRSKILFYIHAIKGKIEFQQMEDLEAHLWGKECVRFSISNPSLFAPWYLDLRKDFRSKFRRDSYLLNAEVTGIGKLGNYQCFKVVVTAPDSLPGGKMIYWVDVNTRTTVRQYFVYRGRIYGDFYRVAS